MRLYYVLRYCQKFIKLHECIQINTNVQLIIHIGVLGTMDNNSHTALTVLHTPQFKPL